MQKKKISIIVPVYKVEKYLDRCVNSIVNQTYSNLEIILVDDGSPDNCPQMCDEWAKKDKRIKVIHKVNGGVSSARNKGLELSSGEFIQFVDSDDYILENYCAELISRFTEEVDLVVAGYTIIDDYKNKIIRNKTAVNVDKIILDEDELLRFVIDGFVDMPVNKLFRRDLITKTFHEGLPLGEDRIFVLDYLRNVKNKIVFAETEGYIYEYNDGSACHKEREDLYEISMIAVNYLKKFLNEHFGSCVNANFYKIVVDKFIFVLNRTNKSKIKVLKNKIFQDENYREAIINYKPQGIKEKLKFFLLKNKMLGLLRYISKTKNK